MRKRIDIYTVLLVAVLAIVSGLFSLVFSNQTLAVNSTNGSVTTTTLQPAAINGGGIYNFNSGSSNNPDSIWFIQVQGTGSGWQECTVTNGINLSISQATIRFSWGAKPYNNRGDRFLRTEKGTWEIFCNGQKVDSGTGVPTNMSKEILEYIYDRLESGK